MALAVVARRRSRSGCRQIRRGPGQRIRLLRRAQRLRFREGKGRAVRHRSSRAGQRLDGGTIRELRPVGVPSGDWRPDDQVIFGRNRFDAGLRGARQTCAGIGVPTAVARVLPARHAEVEDAVERLSRSVRILMFVFVARQSQRVAHRLAVGKNEVLQARCKDARPLERQCPGRVRRHDVASTTALAKRVGQVGHCCSVVLQAKPERCRHNARCRAYAYVSLSTSGLLVLTCGVRRSGRLQGQMQGRSHTSPIRSGRRAGSAPHG